MFKRFLLAVFAATVICSSSGCCCLWQTACCIHNQNLSRRWCCSQCGETYWSEWFNDPPDCCDPCDCCGNFCGCRPHLRGGPGSDYPGPDGPYDGGAYDGETYDGGIPAGQPYEGEGYGRNGYGRNPDGRTAYGPDAYSREGQIISQSPWTDRLANDPAPSPAPVEANQRPVRNRMGRFR